MTIQVLKDKIRGVIEAEHRLIEGELVEACENPGHCAIGALLYAAGMSNQDIRNIPKAVQDWDAEDEATALLEREYGLTQDMAADILDANDEIVGANRLRTRRAAVLDAIDALPDSV